MSPYPSEGSLTSEKREVAASETWDTWGNPQAMSNVEIVDGAIQLAEQTHPSSGVSRWEYEDDSDTSTAIDSWGTEDGAITGATYTTDAQVGSLALEFISGNGDYVGPFSNAAYAFTSGFSVGAWIKVGSQKTRNPVLAKGRSRTTATDHDYYLATGDGSYFFGISDGSTNPNASGGTVGTGTWTHIVGTYDGSTIRVYGDGTEIASSSASLSVQNSHSLHHGMGQGGGATSFFDGIIDDPRVYSKALTATEVNNWYSTGSI